MSSLELNDYCQKNTLAVPSFLDSIRLGAQTADTAGGYFFDEQAGECDGHVGERIGEYVLREMDIDITQKALALLDEKEATVHA